MLVNEQLGLPNTFKYDCRTASDNDLSDSDGEPYSDGAASPENDSSQPMQEGEEKFACILFLQCSFSSVANYGDGGGQLPLIPFAYLLYYLETILLILVSV